VTWLSPWSWLGAATLLAPILIHLLGRGPTRVVRFPSLRFIEGSKWLPAYRTRLQDPLLLAIRLAILLAAVAALAQPLRHTANRQQALDRMLSRVVVLDTSLSMQRLAVSGGTVAETAAREAAALMESADEALLLRTPAPATALHQASEWLREKGGRAEVVIVSDFQRGTIDSGVLAHVPPTTGIMLVPVDAVPLAEQVRTTRQQGRMVTARIATDSLSTAVTWQASTAEGAPIAVRVLGPAGDVEAVRMAIASVGLPGNASAPRAVALLLPDQEERAALAQRAMSPRAEWMLQLIASLRASTTLDGLHSIGTKTLTTRADSAIAVLRTSDGAPLLSAWADSVAGQERLVLEVHAASAPALSAAVLALAARELAAMPPLAEWEQGRVAPEQLASWRRAPAAAAVLRASQDPMTGPSDGRWLWVVALVLLGVESVVRQRRSTASEGDDAVA
jgi:hypothetical protein